MKNDFIIEFKEPYNFEGKEYKELDLSGIQELTADDLCNAQKMLTDMGTVVTMPEIDYTYNLILAAKATKLPLEFFKALPGRYAAKIKVMVTGYFLAD